MYVRNVRLQSFSIGEQRLDRPPPPSPARPTFRTGRYLGMVNYRKQSQPDIRIVKYALIRRAKFYEVHAIKSGQIIKSRADRRRRRRPPQRRVGEGFCACPPNFLRVRGGAGRMTRGQGRGEGPVSETRRTFVRNYVL